MALWNVVAVGIFELISGVEVHDSDAISHRYGFFRHLFFPGYAGRVQQKSFDSSRADGHHRSDRWHNR